MKAAVIESGAAVCKTSNAEGGREAVELKMSFNHSDHNYFVSYLIRTVLELIFAFLLLIYICADGLVILKHADTIICDVHGYFYECSGQPAQFYVYILDITICITCLYILCNVYNLVWMLLPRLGKLSSLMVTYKQNMRAREGNAKTDEELFGDLYNIFYNNRDLRLLLDLLATSSGVDPAISVMALFDKEIQISMDILKILFVLPGIQRSNQTKNQAYCGFKRAWHGRSEISGKK